MALFRILLGTYLVLDAVHKLQFVPAFFSDHGVLPRSVVDLSNISYAFHLQLGMLSGSEWFGYVFLTIVLIFGLFLIIGYRTKLVTVASWFLFSSMVVRMNAISNSGDTLLILLLFWGMFLPLGARFSIDALQKKYRETKESNLLSAATIGLYVQFTLLYITTGIFKGQYLSWLEGTHLYYAFSQFEFLTPIGLTLFPYTELLKFLTHFTLLLELFGPLLLFIPFYFLPFRMIGIALFTGLQLSIVLTMNVGLFTISSLAGILVFLPSQFWEFSFIKKSKTYLTDKFDKTIRFIDRNSIKYENVKQLNPLKTNIYLDLLLSLIVVYVFFWNMNEISSVFSLPDIVKKPGYYLKLDQRWAMFSSTPHSSSYYSVLAYYDDGSTKDLMQDLKVTYNAPDSIKHVVFKGPDRWQKLFSGKIRVAEYDHYRENLLKYFVNKHQSESNPIIKAEIVEHWKIIRKNYDHSPVMDRVIHTYEILE